MAINLGECIKMVRAVEDRIEQEEEALKAKLKPFKELAEKFRGTIMEHLNETGQKSASTEFGSARWQPKVTYRVTDKDEWRRHVIGAEAWELLSWAAAPAQVEEYVQSGEPVPPGLFRNAVNILYINPPKKPRKKVVVNGKEEEVDDDGPEEIKQAAE